MNAFADYQKIALPETSTDATETTDEATREHRPSSTIRAELEAVPAGYAALGFAGVVGSAFVALIGLLVITLPVAMIIGATLLTRAEGPVEIAASVALSILAVVLSSTAYFKAEALFQKRVVSHFLSMISRKDDLQVELERAQAHESAISAQK